MEGSFLADMADATHLFFRHICGILRYKIMILKCCVHDIHLSSLLPTAEDRCICLSNRLDDCLSENVRIGARFLSWFLPVLSWISPFFRIWSHFWGCWRKVEFAWFHAALRGFSGDLSAFKASFLCPVETTIFAHLPLKSIRRTTLENRGGGHAPVSSNPTRFAQLVFLAGTCKKSRRLWTAIK